MKILSFLPGYMWNGSTLMSTGAALKPTQHMDPRTGDLVYYVRPLFDFGPKIGMYIRRSGIIRAVEEGQA
jgi:hypothetical protein